jgi:SAM-dependent methyltransferase
MDQASPQEQLSRLLTGYWISQALYVAAKLGLADLLKDGSRSADDLASSTSSHPRALYRLLRALASVGVFAEDDRQRFGLTPLAECLRSDVPGSLRALAPMRGDWQYRAWAEFLYTIQTGRSGFEKVYGMPLFDYLAQNPEQGQLFDQAMVGVHGRETAAMLDAYDFSSIDTLADIGGGNGSLLAAVLQKYPDMKAVLFDRPAVAERARANIDAAGLGNRCHVVGGDFFEAVPAGADAYLLRHIIHDWDDEKATTILRNVGRAMAKGGRLLVVEFVLPPGNEPFFGKWFDLAMMAVPGGMERTQEEYQKLFEVAGFRLARVVPTRTEVSVVEAEKMSAAWE